MAIDADDLEPHHKPKKDFEAVNVEKLSIAELNGYIAHCESEIGRARAEIEAKTNLRGDAESLFKS